MFCFFNSVINLEFSGLGLFLAVAACYLSCKYNFDKIHDFEYIYIYINENGLQELEKKKK